jgi:hypothetical protein
LKRENDGAIILADHGYRVHQNPSPQQVAGARIQTGDLGKAASRPDYLVEGHVFDCYAPKETRSPRGIWDAVSEKVDDEQTQRVVVNLQDWRGDVDMLRKQFADWPVHGLKELKVIMPNREIVQIWHS